MSQYSQRRRIINLVDSGAQINRGIWSAATSTASLLLLQNVETELWIAGTTLPQLDEPVRVLLLSSTLISSIPALIQSERLDKGNDIIVSHGAWRFCTKWGYEFSKLGFKWIYTPHGMLEPWAMHQKIIKKKLYFYFFEQRMAESSAAIRAVSNTEKINLTKLFPHTSVQLIPNGVKIEEINTPVIIRYQFLFLGRLHKKKGIMELVEGWQRSLLNNNPNYTLIIAGPDEGELDKIQPLLNNSINIKYVGAVYGAERSELFKSCNFFVLPSYSEGFPVTALEAMSFGLISLLSSGCNLPEAISEGVAIEIIPDPVNIQVTLERILLLSEKELNTISNKAYQFVKSHFSIESIAQLQLNTYNALFLS